MKKYAFLLCSLLILACMSLVEHAVAADGGSLTIDLNSPGLPMSPNLYGLMTEEINHSYDGGLYAELIQNRDLKDDSKNPTHWSVAVTNGAVASIALSSDHPKNTALTASLLVTVVSVPTKNFVSIVNDGYWGIPVWAHTAYTLQFFAHAAPGFTGHLSPSITSDAGDAMTKAVTPLSLSGDWKLYTVHLITGDTASSLDNHFVLSIDAPGTVWITHVSLFPPTYHGRANGNRRDLMAMLNALNPTFLRLPGGNYLEGNSIAERFEWKNTIGPVVQRPGHWGPWGYRSSDGLGLLEFLEWCEDLKIQPVLAVYAGYSLDGEHVNPGPDLTPYVQDALDEIQYVTGDKSTVWGKRRILDGHPAPFKLNYIEIGNEDGFDHSQTYDGRFAQFFDAIRAQYPELKLIATTGVQSRTPDVFDEHFYRTAADMERDVHHYDSYSRTGPHIFVGEWASTEGSPTPNFRAALGDAAWLTGLERNSDIVDISSYAPLLVNVNPGASQWGTNLIGYDALHSFGSPSYYVQTMFSSNKGDTILPVTLNVPTVAATILAKPLGEIGLETWQTEAEFKDITVTNNDQTLYSSNFQTDAHEWSKSSGDWNDVDGALQQTSDDSGCRAEAGDTSWTDYIYHLQAGKIAGKEGFLIVFHYLNDNNLVMWNIGGWGNTRTRLQSFHDGSEQEFGPNSNVTVEAGRWYDIRIELSGSHIRCYLDNVLVTEADDTLPPPPAPIYASASRELSSGDVILKVVNVSNSASPITINLNGATHVGTSAVATVLTGDPDGQNTIANPDNIVPVKSKLDGVGSSFTHEFPAYSVTVLRISAVKP